MELLNAIKAKRSQYRRLFTKALNEYEKTDSDLSEKERLSKLKLLEEKAKPMMETEELFRKEILNSGESKEIIDKEFDESETYIDKWRLIQGKLATLSIEADHKSVTTENGVAQNKITRYPKLKLPVFDGNVKNWLGFWGQFKKIDSDQNLDDHDKFAYLLQSMGKGSSAEELVRSFPPGGESYSKALQQLQARFGKEDLLIEVYVRDLLSLVLQKNSKLKFSLRKLYDNLESKLRALEVLGVARDKYAAMLYPLVESSLPDDTLRAWQRFRAINRQKREIETEEENSNKGKESRHRMDLDGLLLFLLDEIEGEERVSIASTCFTKNQQQSHWNAKRVDFRNRIDSPSTPSASTLITTAKADQNACIFCTGFHDSNDCYKARNMSIEDRQSAVQKSRSCFLCLDRSHGIAKCRKGAPCIVCGKKHHILLCWSIHSEAKPQNCANIEKDENTHQLQHDETLANLSKTPNVLLQTLIVTLRGQGVKRQARAIIDSASQRSYILKSTATDMQFESLSKEKICHSLFGGTCTDIIDHDVYQVFLSKTDGNYHCNFKALSQDIICGTVPPVGHGEWLQELAEYGISVNDKDDSPIEILIGADIAGKLMTGNFRLLSSGLAAIETKLGWTVMGRNSMPETSYHSTLLVTSMLNKETLISDLWSLDSLGILDPSEKNNKLELHEEARNHFLTTVKVNEEGCFEVNLPCLENHLPLQGNFNLAFKRLDTTVKRLRNEKLYEALAGKSRYPVNIIEHLSSSFYVDNCLTSVCNESELQQFIQVHTDILAERKFELRGWESNNMLNHSTNVTNVLGMHWDRIEDTLKLNISNNIENLPEKVSKRIILATAHKVFDPLGISCPVTLFPKLLLQRLWKSKLSWDQEVDSGTVSEFRRWMNDLNQLRRLKIPRWLHCDFDDTTHFTLHFFCDASKLAYSTAAFIRVEKNDSVQVHLLQARTRIAPCGKKETTINRLELLGATISARLATNILKEFKSENAFFWTDSSTVLSWIQREDVWDVFVHNRVEEIKQLTPKEAWRHVPGSINPADLPSRGCSASYLVGSNWWEGPSWLYLPPEKWPSSDYTVNEEEIAREKKKKIISSLVNLNPRDIISTRFSSYRKTIRVLAWIGRFVHNCKNGRKKGELTVSELNEAEKRMIRLIQIDSFHGVRDKRLEALNPFENNGIICTKTAVFQRDDTSEFRTPAILPGDHPVVRSLIMEDHRRNGHVGVSQVLNSLRERFWLLAGRRAVSSVLRTCVICKRHRAKSINPPTPPLPGDRVRDAAVFQISGIDFAGPLMLKDNKKAWICLFTCAVYRCVHLELVMSLSTETFLQAFHRFAARRGKPSVVYTDNGRNFVGACNAFASIDFKEFSRREIDERITWKFIWWGSWWERLIGLMKRILRKILGKACFNYEEMCTVLCNCEAILNDRPLTVVSAESNLTAITPANFLKEIRSDLLPILKQSTSSKFIERRLRYIQNVREAFRKIFRQEYLGVLKIPRKKSTKSGNLKVGDVVLIGNDQMKRILWPLGMIVELFPGSDGKIRRARIKTQNGELIRAVQNVYPLEVSSSESIPPSIKQSFDRKETESTEKKSENITPVQTEQSPTITRYGRTVKVPQRLVLD